MAGDEGRFWPGFITVWVTTAPLRTVSADSSGKWTLLYKHLETEGLTVPNYGGDDDGRGHARLRLKADTPEDAVQRARHRLVEVFGDAITQGLELRTRPNDRDEPDWADEYDDDDDEAQGVRF